MNHTVYLCDRKACIINGEDLCVDYCERTQKPEYAKNGPCSDPENHPERFDVLKKNIGIIYLEKEDYKKDE